MADTIKEERLRWVLPIIKKEIRLVDAAKVCSYSKRTLERWVAAYNRGGKDALEPKSIEPKRYSIETPIVLKERVIAIRKKQVNVPKRFTGNLRRKTSLLPREQSAKF